MKLWGHLYEVTQLASFIQDYATNRSRPGADSIRPVRDARVILYQWSKVGCSSQGLVESKTNETGRFELDGSIPPDASVFLVAYGHDGTTEGALGLKHVSGCWYRSLPFVPGAIDELHRDFYVARLVLPSESGFSQANLVAVLSETKQQVADLEWIKGTITPNGIVLSCGGKGARASGRLVLNPDLSGDASKILKHSIEDFQLELPGPSWLVGLVTSREAIEASIRAGLHDLAREISKRLRLNAIDLFTHQIASMDSPPAERLVEDTTLSIARLHYTTTSASGHSKTSYTITSEACLGFPRSLVKKDSRL